MKKRQKLVTDEQWELVEPILPPPRRRQDNRGRPWASNRAFEGILCILQTGAAWRFLPEEFPSPSTRWRRLKQWEDEGVWLNAWRRLLGALDRIVLCGASDHMCNAACTTGRSTPLRAGIRNAEFRFRRHCWSERS